MSRLGGHVVADQLVAQGVDTVFGVPGESFLTVLDGLWARRDRVRFVTARHEATASHMAEAWGKLTGRPGVCLATRGPGATHASVGVHTAGQDSTPMLLLLGQVARPHLGREAFQEVDFEAMFAPLAKWAHQVASADEIPAAMTRAFEVALGDRPGPVVLALPEDMQRDATDAPDGPRVEPALRAPAPDDLDRLHAWLAEAERPLIVVGGPRWDQATADALAAWAEAAAVPVAAQFRRQDRIDNAAPAYVGDLGLGCNPALERRVAEADVLVVLGGRFGDIPSGGYTRLPADGAPGQRLVHVHADPAELGRVWSADLDVCAAAPLVVAGLAARGAPDGAARRAWADALRADYAAWSEPAPRNLAGVDLGAVVGHLRDALPADAVVANGAGNYTVWVHRYHRHRRFGTQLAPTSGAMGYGIPAAIAAALHDPRRTVVAFAGDGCFQMAGHELATAVQEGLGLVVIVADNGMLGTIRMHQERSYPGHVEGTALANPDFAALAAAYGCHAERVLADAEFPAALARALAAERPALIHLVTDPRAITPGALLG
ncbi:MAG: thiamine pyrophosphate-binding protein [Actinobacteria bacterium]|nr:thiamine pyrophosphate-binding protein [Actinomycetota bacterium]